MTNSPTNPVDLTQPQFYQTPAPTLNVRQQVWLQAWCSVASANDCKEPSTAEAWAKECLWAFDRLFRTS